MSVQPDNQPTITMPDPPAPTPDEQPTDPGVKPPVAAPAKPGEPTTTLTDGLDEDQTSLLQALFDPDHMVGWVKGLDEFAEREGIKSFKGVDPKSLDPSTQKIVWNMRALMNKVARNAHTAQSEYYIAKQMAEEEYAQAQQTRAQLLALVNNPKLRALLEVEEPDEEPDPLSPEGQALAARREVATSMGQFLDTWKELSEEAQAEAAETLAALERKKEIERLRTWVATLPDWDDVKEDVRQLREATEHRLSVEDCYTLVKARRGQVPNPRPTRAEAAAAAAAAGGGPSPSVGEGSRRLPDTKDINAIADAVRRDPEAAKAYRERVRARRGW